MDRSFKSPLATETERSAPLKRRGVGALALATALFFLPACHSPLKHSSTEEARSPTYAAALSQSKVPDGALEIVDVTFTQPMSGKVSASFEERGFELYPVGEGQTTHYQGLFGIPHGHKPGKAGLVIHPEGQQPVTLGFEIVDGQYPSETLKVDNRKVNPRKRDRIRIKRELVEINEVYRTETRTRYWQGAFAHPINSAITDGFGAKRLYNGQLRNYHGGMDFKAVIGTPIRSAGAGRVLLAKDLFYSGGTVIIDHGYGLLTMYFHMSKIGVKKGQPVSAQELLGLSGKTGRVTGPHLHFQVVVHEVKVNPLNLFEGLK